MWAYFNFAVKKRIKCFSYLLQIHWGGISDCLSNSVDVLQNGGVNEGEVEQTSPPEGATAEGMDRRDHSNQHDMDSPDGQTFISYTVN